MKKSDIVERVAGTGISRQAAREAVDATFAAIGDALAARDEIQIPGFGRFSSTVRPARNGRNPATGAPLVVPARRVARFKPSSRLAERVAA